MEINNPNDFLGNSISMQEMLEFFKSISKIQDKLKPVQFTTIDDTYSISTVDTPDMGLETAILVGEDAYPVQRYASLEEALEGHKKWIQFIEQGNRTVEVLPYHFIPSYKVTF